MNKKISINRIFKFFKSVKYIFSLNQRDYEKQVDSVAKKMNKMSSGDFMLLANAMARAVKYSQKYNDRH